MRDLLCQARDGQGTSSHLEQDINLAIKEKAEKGGELLGLLYEETRCKIAPIQQHKTMSLVSPTALAIAGRVLREIPKIIPKCRNLKAYHYFALLEIYFGRQHHNYQYR